LLLIAHLLARCCSLTQLAFIVGEFDYISKFCHSKDVPGATPVELRIYCPVGETVLGEFALDVAGKCLKLYEEFFQVGISA
jgi:aminopeptidase N